MLAWPLRHVAATDHAALQVVRCLLTTTKPAASGVIAGALTDLVRRKPEPVAENARLRQQLLILQQGVKRPLCWAFSSTLALC